METTYLLLSVAVATLGFLLWYGLSSSLRLPKSFQIQFDINQAYAGRIMRRRIVGFVIYGLIPWLLIFKLNVLGNVSPEDLKVSFEWNNRVTRWVLIFLPLLILFNIRGAGSRYNLTEYPEIRVTIWTRSLVFWNAVSWFLYLVALEYTYRGLLLQSSLMVTGSDWMAIVISVGIYSMIHYFKNNQLSVFAVPFSAILCYATLDCDGSLIPAIVVHFVGGQITEWLAISKHPEIKFER